MISSDFDILSKRNIPYKIRKTNLYCTKDNKDIRLIVYIIGYNLILLPTTFTKEYWSLELASKTIFKKDYI